MAASRETLFSFVSHNEEVENDIGLPHTYSSSKINFHLDRIEGTVLGNKIGGGGLHGNDSTKLMPWLKLRSTDLSVRSARRVGAYNDIQVRLGDMSINNPSSSITHTNK